MAWRFGAGAMHRIALATGMVALAGCAAYQANGKAREQLDAGQFEAALQTLNVAVKDHPDSTELRNTWLRARTEGLTRLLAQAAAARGQGNWNEAESLLSRAAKLDPDNQRVRELTLSLDVERRQAAALAEAEALNAKGQAAAALRATTEALKLSGRHAGLVALQRRLETQQRQQMLDATRAGLAEARPISLDFKDTPIRTVLDLISRHSGVNFVLDKDIRQDLRITVYLRNVRVEDALDLIVSTHQLAKKVLDERTVLIYPNLPDKQREFQEQVIRVFYLASADVKQAAAMLRNMLKVREPFIDERSNLLMLREPPEVIQLAERLINLYDSAEPEVTLELEVLEISSTRLTELGIKFPDTLSLTPLTPAGAAGQTLNSIRDLNGDRIGVSVGGLLLNLRRQVGDFETLANPRVRIKNREKAKVLIGNKVPIVTTTSTATGFISDSVNYIDVGLKLDLEPTIYADDDVSIKVGLEVSSLSDQVKTASGSLAYQIGTRSASTVLRLRDGDTQVLAGLVSREERSSASRVPGLGDVPVLGRLFSNQLDNGARTELVLAITPRIVRNLRRPDINESELWVGTESMLRLRQPGARVRSMAGDESKPSSLGALPGGVAGAGPVADRDGVQPAVAPAAPTWGMRWVVPASVKVGEEFTAELHGNSPLPVRGLNLRLQTKMDQATVVNGGEGAWWTADQATVSVSKALDPATGQWQLGVIRRVAQGVGGKGVIARLTLKALKDGRIEWPVLQADPIAAGPDVPEVKQMPALVLQVSK